MDMQTETQEQTRSQSFTHHDFFDVYRVAIEDLHATKDLGQKIDSFYLTVLTLLLTADAYEIVTAKFNVWTPTLLTAGVMVIGVVVTARWWQGAHRLYQIVRNRYNWLRDAETPGKHAEFQGLGVNIFTHEYEHVYQKTKSDTKKPAQTSGAEERSSKSNSDRKFYNRTLFLQVLCIVIFVVVPLGVGLYTYLNLNPDALQAIQRAIP